MTRLYKLPTKTILTFVRQTELRNKNLVKIPGQNEINPASNSLIKTFQRGSLERGIPISDATHASIDRDSQSSLKLLSRLSGGRGS